MPLPDITLPMMRPDATPAMSATPAAAIAADITPLPLLIDADYCHYVTPPILFMLMPPCYAFLRRLR